VLKRITNTISKDIKPIAVDESTVYYLSDQKGIYNIFKYSISDSIYTQVTNFNSSVSNFDYDRENQLLTFTMMDESIQFVYADQASSLNENVFTPATYRQEIEKAKYVSELLRKRRADSGEDQVELVPDEGGDEELEIEEDLIESTDTLSETSLIDMESV